MKRSEIKYPGIWDYSGNGHRLWICLNNRKWGLGLHIDFWPPFAMIEYSFQIELQFLNIQVLYNV